MSRIAVHVGCYDDGMASAFEDTKHRQMRLIYVNATRRDWAESKTSAVDENLHV